MISSIFGIFLTIVVVLASAQQPQCTAPSSIKSMDSTATYSISGLQNNQTFYYKFNANGSPTTLSLTICSPFNCFSQCAVQAIANNGAVTCYGICAKSATIVGQNNYNGLGLNYTAGGNSAQVMLSCNPQLDPSKINIQQVTLNGSVCQLEQVEQVTLSGSTLSVVGEAYCSSTPQPYTMHQIFFGQGIRCGNWNIEDDKYSYTATCQGGCRGDSTSSVLTRCSTNF